LIGKEIFHSRNSINFSGPYLYGAMVVLTSNGGIVLPTF